MGQATNKTVSKGTIQNSQKLGNNPNIHQRRMDKQVVVWSHSGTLPSNQSKWTTDIRNIVEDYHLMGKRSQAEIRTQHKVPLFRWSPRTGQTSLWWLRSGCGATPTGRGLREPSGVLEMFCILIWVGVTSMKIHQVVTLKLVHFTVCIIFSIPFTTKFQPASFSFSN